MQFESSNRPENIIQVWFIDGASRAPYALWRENPLIFPSNNRNLNMISPKGIKGPPSFRFRCIFCVCVWTYRVWWGPDLLEETLRVIKNSKMSGGSCDFAHDPTKLSVGSACSGWCSELFALRNLGIPFVSCFGCDNDSACRAISRSVHDHHLWYDDVTGTEFEKAPKVDFFFAGFPCQPFSNDLDPNMDEWCSMVFLNMDNFGNVYWMLGEANINISLKQTTPRTVWKTSSSSFSISVYLQDGSKNQL